MSLGPIMLDLEGVELTPEERELLAHPGVGGVILFSRNFASVDQLEALVSEIHALRRPRLLVAVDHEGGRVQRFRDGFTLIPVAGHLGRVFDQDPHRGRRLAETAGWVMAVELRAVGIDFSFAPVLDIDHGASEVIGDRAFHAHPDVVTDLGRHWIKGMHEAGMAATGKHFPGHGAVAADSHTDLPVDRRDYKDIYAHDIVPFKRLVHHGLAAVMPAHVVYAEVDARPAGFSAFWLQDVLRKRLGFQGVIFSDDLNMAGAAAGGETFADRATLARQAGCDMLLVCNNRAGAIEVVEHIGDPHDPVSYLRLARMHGRHDITRRQLHSMGKWQEAVATLEKYQDDPSLAFDF